MTCRGPAPSRRRRAVWCPHLQQNTQAAWSCPEQHSPKRLSWKTKTVNCRNSQNIQHNSADTVSGTERVILCCKTTHLTQMWLCATSSASASLVTSPSQNRPQTVNFLPILLLLLISYLLLQSFHSVHPFQAASFFCRHMNTLYPPCQNKNLWPVLFLLVLLCSKALEFTSFWYSSH